VKRYVSRASGDRKLLLADQPVGLVCQNINRGELVMWTRFCAAAGLFAVLAGCDDVTTNTPSTPPQAATPASPDKATPVSPDNTAVNERDAEGATKTPIDQDENQADVERTAEIRKRILDEPDLSVNARNAKVITSQGKVTLRGPVNSEAERDILVKITTDVAGAENVDNQLEFAPAQP
jgi:osmotically-inducible protein OsmY